MRRLLLALLLTAAPVAAHAQGSDADDDKPAAPADKKADVPTPKAQGNLAVAADKPVDAKYQGVAPGAQALPPKAPRLPLKKGPQRMTWSGFQVKDGVPTVFLETTGAPQYSVDDEPGAVTVTLKNTVVPLKNNRRALDVNAFATAVQAVEAAPKGHDVRVTIKTKGTTKPQHRERVEDAAGGFHMLVIELP
jgi:type II secretory pathway component HofQ